MRKIIKYAFASAIGTASYVIIVALFLYFLQNGAISTSKSPLIAIAMLLLFVFSAALTGILVFGRPLMWYLDGKKKEALSLLGYVLGILLIITVLAFFVLIIFGS